MYSQGLGHGVNNITPWARKPDNIAERPGLYKTYVNNLLNALSKY
jgi:hypothetical protein